MKESLSKAALDQLFFAARTYNSFLDKEISDQCIGQLYETLKWGPTAVNCQPARFVFLKTPGAKKRLLPCLPPGGNISKVQSAPVTVIVATDTKFYEHLPSQWSAYDAKTSFVENPALSQETSFRNATLGGAYLILAARALGLDCGPMSGFDNAKVDKEFFADGRFKSNFLVSLGYGDDKSLYPRGPRLEFHTAVCVL